MAPNSRLAHALTPDSLDHVIISKIFATFVYNATYAPVVNLSFIKSDHLRRSDLYLNAQYCREADTHPL